MRRSTLLLASIALAVTFAACKKKGELKQDVVVRDGQCVKVSTCVVNAKTDPTPAECDPAPPAAQPTECPEALKSSLPSSVQKAEGAQQILNQGAAATASATATDGW